MLLNYHLPYEAINQDSRKHRRCLQFHYCHSSHCCQQLLCCWHSRCLVLTVACWWQCQRLLFRSCHCRVHLLFFIGPRHPLPLFAPILPIHLSLVFVDCCVKQRQGYWLANWRPSFVVVCGCRRCHRCVPLLLVSIASSCNWSLSLVTINTVSTTACPLH